MTHTTTVSSSAPARSEIDRSVKGTVLFCFGAAICWLVAGAALQFLAGAKLVLPGFLDGMGFLTYGRVQPAATNALVFGWASLAGLGTAIWLGARLAGAVLRVSTLLISAIIAWNVALLAGVLAILAGKGTGIPGLEMPGAVAFILLVAYLPIALWVLTAFRSSPPAFVSQWYLVAALFAFPWLYTTANALLVWNTIPGSAMGPIFAWFDSGFFGLWLAPLALAPVFYFLPKAAGRPVFSGGLASIGFWMLLVCAGWMGTSRFQGGPIPAWMVSAGVVAAILLILPAIAVSTNIYLTIGDTCSRIWMQTPARFLIVAVIGFLGWSAVVMLSTFPAVNSIVHFSLLSPGLVQAALFGFVSMAFLGVFYALLDAHRPVGEITPRASLIFWLLVTGTGLILVGSFFGGLIQGFALNDPVVTFSNTLTYAAPFRWVELTGQLCVFASALVAAKEFFGWLLFPSSLPVKPAAPASRTVEVTAV